MPSDPDTAENAQLLGSQPVSRPKSPKFHPIRNPCNSGSDAHVHKSPSHAGREKPRREGEFRDCPSSIVRFLKDAARDWTMILMDISSHRSRGPVRKDGRTLIEFVCMGGETERSKPRVCMCYRFLWFCYRDQRVSKCLPAQHAVLGYHGVRRYQPVRVRASASLDGRIRVTGMMSTVA